jgi:pyruvate dehydrogenase phosphatase regulatory subunit
MQLSSLIVRRPHSAIITSRCLPLIADVHPRHASTQGPLPRHAEVVICGGGLVGNSTAYHLTQKGKDVLLLERNEIGGTAGSTGFDAGTIGHLKPLAMRRIIKESLNLYRHLNDLGYNIGFQPCGSISLAQTKDRRIALKRRMAYNLPTGLYCELISKEDIKRLHPYLYTDDLECGVWVPEDATADCRLVCRALVECGGYSYREKCTVDDVIVDKGRVVGVKTSAGEISCDYFINCAGIWARDLGLKSNPPVRIPAYPAEQFCATTGDDAALAHETLPIIFDPDSYLYSRQLSKKLVFGWFEPEAKPISCQSYVPQAAKQEMPKNISEFWQKFLSRVRFL